MPLKIRVLMHDHHALRMGITFQLVSPQFIKMSTRTGAAPTGPPHRPHHHRNEHDLVQVSGVFGENVHQIGTTRVSSTTTRTISTVPDHSWCSFNGLKVDWTDGSTSNCVQPPPPTPPAPAWWSTCSANKGGTNRTRPLQLDA